MEDYEKTDVETYRRMALAKTEEVERLSPPVADLQKQEYNG